MKLPRKLSKQELEAANEDLLRRHREHLERWEEAVKRLKIGSEVKAT